MNVTISFDIKYEDSDELFAWLEAAMEGEPVGKKRTRKARRPMTDEEKAEFRARMLKGQEEAARRRGEEQATKSNSPATKKSAKGRKATKASEASSSKN